MYVQMYGPGTWLHMYHPLWYHYNNYSLIMSLPSQSICLSAKSTDCLLLDLYFIKIMAAAIIKRNARQTAAKQHPRIIPITVPILGVLLVLSVLLCALESSSVVTGSVGSTGPGVAQYIYRHLSWVINMTNHYMIVHHLPSDILNCRSMYSSQQCSYKSEHSRQYLKHTHWCL